MIKKEQIDNHDIFSSMSAIIAKYIMRSGIKTKNLAVASPAEQYAINCFHSLRNITNCLDQLIYAVDLLSGFRNTLTPKTMNRHDYIVFGIENYYLRITSIYDRCLRATNTVFQLGLPERECKNSTILKNDHVKNTSVVQCLKKLDRFTGQFRCYRNIIAHSATFDDQDGLGHFERYCFLADRGSDDITAYKHLFKQKADEYIKKKKIEFSSQLECTFELVIDYFNQLKPLYLARYKRYFHNT